MFLAIAVIGMTMAVVALVVAPLAKSTRAAPSREEFDRAIYRDQLKEVEREVEGGLIAPAEAGNARLEIERRLLAADAPPADGTDAPPRRPGSPVLAVALAVTLPAVAALVYLATGSPTLPDDPYAGRAAERALVAENGPHDLAKAETALEAKLKAQPGNGADWLLLARTAAALGHWQKSADAYREAMRLDQGRPDITADYGEMLVMAAEGIVTPRAAEAFTAALAKDPKNVVARYYLALADHQEGRTRTALDAWRKLAKEQPLDSPLRGELNHRMAEAAREAGLPAPAPVKTAAPPAMASAAPSAAGAPGPSAEQMAAAAQMSPADRDKMIRTMVGRLAAQLEEKPNDLDGWMRLGRAYGVLGEREKAADAYEHAATLKPDDPAILLGEAEALLPDHKPQTPVPPRALALFKRIETLDPKQPAALWYLGLAAAQQRHFEEAGGYWKRLLEVLPADSDQHQAVAAAIDALNGKKD